MIKILASIVGLFAFAISILFGVAGVLVFDGGGWGFFILGLVVIAILYQAYRKKKEISPEIANFIFKSLRGMIAGWGLVLIICVIGMFLNRFPSASVVASGKIKTANECLEDHMRNVEVIRTFVSDDGQKRKLDEALVNFQACNERALQSKMSK